MNRMIAACAAWMVTVASAQSATIDLTDLAALNTGATSASVNGVTLTAAPDGYLQFTGYGVGVCQSTGGWSCNEVEHPERLIVQLPGVSTLDDLTFGYFQSATPAANTPTFLPMPELVGVQLHQRVNGALVDVGMPLFFSGTSMDGWRTVAVNATNVSAFSMWGLGHQFYFTEPGLMGASLARFNYTLLPPDRYPPPVPDDPVPVPTPATWMMLSLGLACGVRRWRSR